MIKVKMMHGDMILLSKDSQENNAPQVFSINLCQEEEYLEERKVFQKVVMNQLQVCHFHLFQRKIK